MTDEVSLSEMADYFEYKRDLYGHLKGMTEALAAMQEDQEPMDKDAWELVTSSIAAIREFYLADAAAS